MRTPLLIVSLLAVAACGAADVEGSSEYQSLVVDNDALTAELEAARAQLESADDQIDDLDDQMAVAEAELESAGEVADDLGAFLALDVANRAGLNGPQSECVAEAMIDDVGGRQAYLLLLEATDPDGAEDAYDQVLVMFAKCGVDTPDAPEDAFEVPPELVGLLGEPEVTGVALPQRPVGDVADPAVGMTAPVVVGAGYDGQPVRIDAATDGPTMVVFLAHWCPHCNVEVPKLLELRDRGGIPDGVNVVAVSTAIDPVRGNFPPNEWLDELGWDFPTIADGIDESNGFFITSSNFGLSGVPFTTVIDGDGVVVERWAGERDPAEIEQVLADLVELTG